MAHVEIELISNIVERGDWRAVTDADLIPDHFLTPEGFEVFGWLFEEYGGSREVPSRQRLRRKFPNFEFCTTRDPIKILIREVRQNHIRADLTEILEEINSALGEGEDPAELLSLHLGELRNLTVEYSEPDGVLMGRSAEAMMAEYKLTKESGGVLGIPFPWEPLNRATGGMQNGQFIVIYARPKNMKTFLLCITAVTAYLLHGRRVVVYSKEMTIQQLRRRCAAMICKLDDREIRTGQLSPEDEEYYFDMLFDLEELEQESALEGRREPGLLFLSDKGVKGGSTVESLRARIEKFDPDLLCADGFYLMRDGRSGKRNREWTTVGNVSGDLKELALEMDIPVLGTTQANREAAKSYGDDLAEVAFADAIAQDADVVMRCVKGKAPEGTPEVLITFPGVRDAEIAPFTINAVPGRDFSVRRTSVNVKDFIDHAKRAYLEDQGVSKEEAPKVEEKKRTKKPRKAAKKGRIRA